MLMRNPGVVVTVPNKLRGGSNAAACAASISWVRQLGLGVTLS